jgi:hypothetical protein
LLAVAFEELVVDVSEPQAVSSNAQEIESAKETKLLLSIENSP